MSFNRDYYYVTYSPEKDTTINFHYYPGMNFNVYFEYIEKKTTSLLLRLCCFSRYSFDFSKRLCQLKFPSDTIRTDFEECLKKENIAGAINILEKLEFNSDPIDKIIFILKNYLQQPPYSKPSFGFKSETLQLSMKPS